MASAAPAGHAAIPSGAPQGYIPCDIVRAYHLDLLHSSGTNGAGQEIAIVDAFDNPTAGSDLHSFDAALGLPDPAFQVYNLGASGTATNTAWEEEINLDIEWAHAAAPGAATALVEAPTAQLDSTSASLLAAVDYAVNVVGADVVSMSWGGAEFTGERRLIRTSRRPQLRPASPSCTLPRPAISASGRQIPGWSRSATRLPTSSRRASMASCGTPRFHLPLCDWILCIPEVRTSRVPVRCAGKPYRPNERPSLVRLPNGIR